jgi:hypothetical protein
LKYKQSKYSAEFDETRARVVKACPDNVAAIDTRSPVIGDASFDGFHRRRSVLSGRHARPVLLPPEDFRHSIRRSPRRPRLCVTAVAGRMRRS